MKKNAIAGMTGIAALTGAALIAQVTVAQQTTPTQPTTPSRPGQPTTPTTPTTPSRPGQVTPPITTTPSTTTQPGTQRPMGQADIQHIRDFARVTQDSANRLERLNQKIRDLVTQAKSASGEQQSRLVVEALDNIVQEHEFMMRDMTEARALIVQHELVAAGQSTELDNMKRDFSFLRDARGTVLGTDVPGMLDNKPRDHNRDLDKDKDKDKDMDKDKDQRQKDPK